MTIISSVNVDTIMNTTVEKQARIKQYCEEQPWITLLQNVSNERVLEILKDSHIGFLPTIQDTFGYSILEMQASGCPVVTTDIRALEEINNDTLGWIIPIRKNCISKESFYHNEMELEIACQQIENELVKILEEIISRWIHGDTSYFIQKAIGCIEHIDRNNNPIKYGERLESIYKESVLETHR